MEKKRILPILAIIMFFFSGCGLTTRHGLVSRAEANSLSNVFKRVNPAVVVIVTKEGGYSRTIPETPVIKGGLGSGIVISKNGLVMTAAHVVQVADEVSVHFLDGSQVMAKVVSSAAWRLSGTSLSLSKATSA